MSNLIHKIVDKVKGNDHNDDNKDSGSHSSTTSSSHPSTTSSSHSSTTSSSHPSTTSSSHPSTSTTTTTQPLGTTSGSHAATTTTTSTTLPSTTHKTETTKDIQSTHHSEHHESHSRSVPVERETKERAAVVEETIHKEHVKEIQPVIHRDIHQTEVKQIVQPVHEKQVEDTKVYHKETKEVKPTVTHNAENFTRDYNAGTEQHKSSTVTREAATEHVNRAPIIEETIHKKVIEEVQPVIHREVIKPEMTKETHHIYEKIEEAPVLTHEERAPRDISTDVHHTKEVHHHDSHAPKTVHEDTKITTSTVTKPNPH